MSEPLNLADPGRTIHAGVILTGGTTEILDVAPIDLLSSITAGFITELPDSIVSPELKAQAIPIQFHWVTEKGVSASMTSGIKLEATDSFDTCPPLDIALMGAHNGSYKTSQTELEFIRKTYKTCTAFVSICGGYIPLLEAGLLDGKKATGPRFWIENLRKTAPGTDWQEKRWVHDGKIWTSGALLNGTDLMRALGTEIWGQRKDSLIARALDIGAWPSRDVDYKDV